MYDTNDDDLIGLDTTIDWKNTDDNSYDGEKLLLLVHDESGKWIKPNNILNNWRVTKTCLRLGSKIIGKCMMGSTSNALDKGGDNFKKLYYDSDVTSVMQMDKLKVDCIVCLFLWNGIWKGSLTDMGMPVLETPKDEVVGIDGEMIYQGSIDYWENRS